MYETSLSAKEWLLPFSSAFKQSTHTLSAKVIMLSQTCNGMCNSVGYDILSLYGDCLITHCTLLSINIDVIRHVVLTIISKLFAKLIVTLLLIHHCQKNSLKNCLCWNFDSKLVSNCLSLSFFCPNNYLNWNLDSKSDSNCLHLSLFKEIHPKS